MKTTHTVSCKRKKTITPGYKLRKWEKSIFTKNMDMENFDQDILFNATIFLIGCGGLGSHLALLLARLGFGHIILCDADKIESTNLNRQFFYPKQIGQNKAFALFENIQKECTYKTKITAYPYDFPNVLKEFPNALSGVDIILCMVDNDQARYDSAKYGIQLGIPVVTSGITQDMKMAKVHVQESSGPCYCCFNPPVEIEDTERIVCLEPAVIDIHAAIVGVSVRTILSQLMGWNLPWNVYTFNMNGASRSDNLNIRKDCEICSIGGD